VELFAALSKGVVSPRFAFALLEKAGVGVAPGVDYGQDGEPGGEVQPFRIQREGLQRDGKEAG
jgi:hypothetical protein